MHQSYLPFVINGKLALLLPADDSTSIVPNIILSASILFMHAWMPFYVFDAA
ncbi:hypothetical protein M440DRAFT_1400575 [Trichoderma longibrachiatum ATCC 18648]|uniref:Uncharacterized protein n=1 Tax=Trichoderma longibrachiatum ATCC 18648 TaxID=983965 RepID=A0A2T4C7X9_TRILO|nr:hypothetical protein M440DRAFT_1400575 [Trichoderma longibrachiatum ATCC 18648]